MSVLPGPNRCDSGAGVARVASRACGVTDDTPAPPIARSSEAVVPSDSTRNSEGTTVKRSRLVFGGVGLAVTAIAVIAIATTGGASSSKSSSAPVHGSSSSAPSYAPATVPAPVTAAPAPAPQAAAGAVARVTHDANLGDIVVAGSGRTVYLFEQDMGTVSACTGACANTWAPWMTNGAPTGGPGVDAALLGSAHGQVTYAGHLLYFFAGDHAAGDTSGTGIPSWDAISATGMQVGH